MRSSPPASTQRSPADGLYGALRDGDESALQELLPPLRERLTRLAKQRVRVEVAEEVVQETLRTLWEKREAVASPAELLPFVFQILRNKIGNLYQRARTERGVMAEDEGSREAADVNPAIDPARAYGAREFDRILTQAVEKCARENPIWGRVLQLLREERSPREIQQELGDVPMATVHTRIFRARRRLKQILAEDHGLEL